MNPVPQWRWTLAGKLCRFAAWLRREKWYYANAFHGVEGNRANELESQIRDNVILNGGPPEVWMPILDSIQPKVAELAQMAQTKWRNG